MFIVIHFRWWWTSKYRVAIKHTIRTLLIKANGLAALKIMLNGIHIKGEAGSLCDSRQNVERKHKPSSLCRWQRRYYRTLHVWTIKHAHVVLVLASLRLKTDTKWHLSALSISAVYAVNAASTLFIDFLSFSDNCTLKLKILLIDFLFSNRLYAIFVDRFR